MTNPYAAPVWYVQKLTRTMKTSGAMRKKPSHTAPGSAQSGRHPTGALLAALAECRFRRLLDLLCLFELLDVEAGPMLRS